MYADEITLLASDQHKHDHEFRQDRLAQYLIILHISGKLPDDLLAQFWQNATSHMWQRAMWFLQERNWCYLERSSPTRCGREGSHIGSAG